MISRREIMIKGGSPYDLNTTNYLRSNFAPYWLQIRNYGASNPSIVPFINADNDLIMSIFDMGYTRRIYATNNSAIDTGWRASGQSSRIVLDAIPTLFGTYRHTYRLSGAYDGTRTIGIWVNFQKFAFSIGTGDYTSSIPLVVNEVVKADVLFENNVVSGEVNGTSLSMTYTGSQTTCQRTSWLFAANEGSTGTGFDPYIKLAYYKIYEGDTLMRHFVPCKNPNGNDYGMLDLANAVWHGNIKTSGYFSVEVTANS